MWFIRETAIWGYCSFSYKPHWLLFSLFVLRIHVFIQLHPALGRSPPLKPVIYEKKSGGGWGWGYIAPSSGWADRPSSSSCYANIPTTSSASCSLFCCLVLRLYLTVCDTINCSPVRLPHQWVFPGKNTGLGFTSFSWGSSRPRCWTCISYIGRQTLYHWATDEALPPNPVQSQFPTLGIRKWSDWLHLLRVN